ncbi:unnamed protein product [Paramecium sonneborni]|uniref:Tetratricopeptide repeat protein n=1 Tax=Paramecium sonneborni TaxID=65129 RepID=A0A8S1RQA2_9CILI|nr:unnamed protein product [Paramecium sonneborni]
MEIFAIKERYSKQLITQIQPSSQKSINNLLHQLFQNRKRNQLIHLIIYVDNYNYHNLNSKNLSKELFDKGYELKKKFNKVLIIYMGNKYDETIQMRQNNRQQIGACLLPQYQLQKMLLSLGWTRLQLLTLSILIAYLRKIDLIIIILLGQCLRILNQYEEAIIIWLDKAFAIKSKHMNSLFDKCQCLRLLKKCKESLDQALSINPQHTFSLQIKGNVYMKTLSSYIQEINKIIKKLLFIMRNHKDQSK